jgi:hypothetical protein
MLNRSKTKIRKGFKPLIYAVVQTALSVKIKFKYMIAFGGPQQIRNPWKWAARQILVYMAMPFRPLLQWLLDRTDSGY